MIPYAKGLILFFTVFCAMALVEVVTEFIDDTPLEFNHEKVLVLLTGALLSGVIVLALKRKEKMRTKYEINLEHE